MASVEVLVVLAGLLENWVKLHEKLLFFVLFLYSFDLLRFDNE